MQRPKNGMQNTVKLFQFPVFNYYMLTENSGKTGISSLFFAHIFQIMQDILTGNFLPHTWRRKDRRKSDCNKWTRWMCAKKCSGDNSRSYWINRISLFPVPLNPYDLDHLLKEWKPLFEYNSIIWFAFHKVMSAKCTQRS